MPENPLKTLVVDNFRGNYASSLFGDINSGFSWFQTSAGANPFIKPGQLTWSNAPVQINADEDIITDLILAGKERVESGILYVYAIGHTGRLYKIQVNDPSTFNPDNDIPALVATLSSGSPTFTRGAFIDFFGSTEQIYIGHDKGVTKISFDGTGEAVVGVQGSWTQTVPRPLKQFLGKLYAGNGENLAEILVGGTVADYTKLDPAFPAGTQVRDIDIAPNGNYIEAVVSFLALTDVTSTAVDTSSTANAGSFIFRWNGTDIGYTSFSSFPSFSLSANIMFQNFQYTFGTDQYGSAIYNPSTKIMAIPETPSAMPNAVISTGNLLVWMTPLYFNDHLEADLMVWGSYNFDVGGEQSFWDMMFMDAKSPETDVLRVPCIISASNTGLGSSSSGYVDNVFGTSKIYFSTLETSDGPTTAYRFYYWKPNSISPLQVSSGDAIGGGLYQTQSQMFSKKVKVSEIRIYGENWIADNSFTIDLIGPDGEAITNSGKTFTAGTNLTVGDDFVSYVPEMAPTYCIGLRIINEGTANYTINKVEIDYSAGGK